MTVLMGQICYGNSALYWPGTTATWGRTAELKNSPPLVQTLCKCSLKNTVWKWLKHWKAKRETIPNKAACVQLCCWYHPWKVYTEVLCLTSYFRLISFMGRAINKRKMSWMLFSAGEKCYYKTDTSCHPGKASLPQVIILPPNTVENNETVILRLPLSKLIVQSWNEKQNKTEFVWCSCFCSHLNQYKQLPSTACKIWNWEKMSLF